VLEIINLHKLEKVPIPALAKYGTCVLMVILGKVWSIPNFGADSLPPCRYLTTYTTDEDNYEPSLTLLAETVEKIRKGVYKKEVFLDSVFDLKDVGKAHERMEANVACGKIVLRC